MAVGDAYVFPGFLTPLLTQLFFPKPPTTFLTCFRRGERRKYAGKKSRLNRGLNSQPPGHEFVTSNFSFSHTVFYSFGELSSIFIKFEIIICLNRGSNSQPPGHESDTLTTEPPSRKWNAITIISPQRETGQWQTNPNYLFTLSQMSPGFYMSAVHVLRKQCGKRRNCS